MQLNPRRQPGRIDRKAAAYASEIARLRGAGYTYEAIQEAMAEVGVELSTSSLRREVRRFHARIRPTSSAGPQALTRTTANQVSSPLPLRIDHADGPVTTRQSKSIAASFVREFDINPLLKRRSQP